MTTYQKRQEILQSLDRLDAIQAERVLGYIHELLPGQYALRRQHYKRKALREINQALRQG